jgi:hypothetical protein
LLPARVLLQGTLEVKKRKGEIPSQLKNIVTGGALLEVWVALQQQQQQQQAGPGWGRCVANLLVWCTREPA